MIKTRRSIRKYKQTEIPESVIEDVLDSARYAPSSMNGQPWEFLVVRDSDKKRRLSAIKNKYCPIEKLKYSADFLCHVPVIIILCVNLEKSYDRTVENSVLAASHILLKACEKGLGTVYMSAYKTGEPKLTEDIKHLFNIPDSLVPITLIPIGYPDEIPEVKNLVPLRDIVSYETFGT